MAARTLLQGDAQQVLAAVHRQLQHDCCHHVVASLGALSSCTKSIHNVGNNQGNYGQVQHKVKQLGQNSSKHKPHPKMPTSCAHAAGQPPQLLSQLNCVLGLHAAKHSHHAGHAVLQHAVQVNLITPTACCHAAQLAAHHCCSTCSSCNLQSLGCLLRVTQVLGQSAVISQIQLLAKASRKKQGRRLGLLPCWFQAASEPTAPSAASMQPALTCPEPHGSA